MKALISVALAILSWNLCAAQTPSSDEKAAPGVAVVEKGWRKILVRNPALDQDPLLPLEDQARSERIRQEAIRQNKIRADLGREQIPLPSRNAQVRIPPPKAPYPFEYIYRIKIANTGVKKIRGLVWEYVLIEPSKGIEVGRHRFTNKLTVRPGDTKVLFGYSTLPPVSSVAAGSAGEESESRNLEQVLIKTIYYDDNSVWERPLD